jgi:5-methylcytosine-specific restriction endonuclease McrA
MAKAVYRVKSYRQALARTRKTRPECAICGQPGADSIDHIRPVATFPAGTPASVISDPVNLRPTHLRCNLQRGRKLSRSRHTPRHREENRAYR